MEKFNSLKAISKHKSICLIGHSSPDADALSSMLVFCNFLKQYFNISKVDIFAECKSIPKNCNILLQEDKINPPPSAYDVAIMFDSPNSERLGAYKCLFDSAKLTVVIDHHQTNLLEGEINIVKPVSSTCEIVYEISKYFKFSLSSIDQERIYAGIITDTNNLTVGMFNSSTFNILSEVIENIDSEKIYNNFFNNNSLKNMQLLALAINNIKSYENEKIIISHISFRESKKLKAKFDDFVGISNRLASIENCAFVCFIYPNKNHYYVSMRATKNYNVAEIAKIYGGGGHNGAAAFTSKSANIKKISKQILRQFKQNLHKL